MAATAQRHWQLVANQHLAQEPSLGATERTEALGRGLGRDLGQS